MPRAPMHHDEVKSRLAAIERYNRYFANELDKDGQPLTQHIVTDRQRSRFMTEEWGVDPKKFGIAEPPEYKPAAPKPATDLTHGL